MSGALHKYQSLTTSHDGTRYALTKHGVKLPNIHTDNASYVDAKMFGNFIVESSSKAMRVFLVTQPGIEFAIGYPVMIMHREDNIFTYDGQIPEQVAMAIAKIETLDIRHFRIHVGFTTKIWRWLKRLKKRILKQERPPLAN